jgi:hypothetical protein
MLRSTRQHRDDKGPSSLNAQRSSYASTGLGRIHVCVYVKSVGQTENDNKLYTGTTRRFDVLTTGRNCFRACTLLHPHSSFSHVGSTSL